MKKIFSPAILIISLILFAYTFYKSEIYWNLLRDKNMRDFYFYYYVVTSLLIIVSIITFFLNDKIKEYLVISCISVFASLYLFEGFLIYKVKFPKEYQLKKKMYEKQTEKKWDTRTRIEIYKDLKKTNDEIVMKLHPTAYFHKILPIYPLAGISNSKTVHCNENGYFSIYQSDRYGFNNPDVEWDKKEINYFLVGDSFIHGNCVNRPHDISSVLRKLSNKSVLNLGLAGNGPLTEYATIREYLDKNVKKVIWVYFERNDLENLQEESGRKILKNYLNDLNFTQNLKLRQNEIDKIEIDFLETEKKKLKYLLFDDLIKFIKLYELRDTILSKSSKSINSQSDFKKILELSKKLTEKNYSKLYLVYLPEYDRYKKAMYDNTNYNLVKDIVKELNIPFIDIHKEVFEKEENPLKLFPFEQIGHYNIEGYKKVAKTIYKFTKD